MMGCNPKSMLGRAKSGLDDGLFSDGPFPVDTFRFLVLSEPMKRGCSNAFCLLFLTAMMHVIPLMTNPFHPLIGRGAGDKR